MKKYSSSKLLNKAIIFEKLANNPKLSKFAYAQIVIFIAMLVVPIIAQILREHFAKAESLKVAIDKLFSELDDIEKRYQNPLQQIAKDTFKGVPFVSGIVAPIGAAYKAYDLNKEYPKYEKKIKKFRSDVSSFLNTYNELLQLVEASNQNKTPEMQQKLLSKINEYYELLKEVNIGIPILANDITDLKTFVDKFIEGVSMTVIQGDFKDVLDTLPPLNAKIAETIQSVNEISKNINSAIAQAQEQAKAKFGSEMPIEAIPSGATKQTSAADPEIGW